MKVSCWNGLYCIIVINGHSDGDLNVVIELSSKSAGECTLGGSSNSKEIYFVTCPILCHSRRAVKSPTTDNFLSNCVTLLYSLF